MNILAINTNYNQTYKPTFSAKLSTPRKLNKLTSDIVEISRNKVNKCADSIEAVELKNSFNDLIGLLKENNSAVVGKRVDVRFSGDSKDIEAYQKLLSEKSELALRLIESIKLTTKSKIMPEKLEFTEVEMNFNEISKAIRVNNLNQATQKENLKMYYSSNDRVEYRELLRIGRNLASQRKRIAKNAGISEDDLELIVEVKKEYNKFAKKIFRATTNAELDAIQESISADKKCGIPKILLDELIATRRKT